MIVSLSDKLKAHLDGDIQQNAVMRRLMMIQPRFFRYITSTTEYILLPTLLLLESSSGYFHLILSIFSVVLFLGLLYKLQDRILYHPSVPDNSKFFVQLPIEGEVEIVQIKTKDGVLLHGYLVKRQTEDRISAPTVVYFHGNAGNAGSPSCMMLNMLCAVNVLSVDYRGYGKSAGEPSEEGFYEDAYSCVEYLYERNDIDTNKIILFGHSLGGAVAIHTAAKIQAKDEHKLAAVIVENTFTSIMDIGQVISGISHIVKLLPNCFYKNKFSSRDKISSIRVPILFIRGEKDEIVCPSMIKSLYDTANNPRSCILSVANGHHNDTWCSSPHYHIYISKFINKIFNNGENRDWKWEVVINV